MRQTREVPEGPEAEIARRAMVPVVGRTIRAVRADERCADPGLAALVGCRVTGVDRHGKWVVVATDGPALGIHFGMTGRVVVDDAAPIERLEYGSGRDDPAWDRLVVQLDRGHIRVNDPRRWSRFRLDPDLHDLGPDVFGLSPEQLSMALVGRRALKAVLLDQSRVAGLGNLCVDEVLFHAGLPPDAPATDLTTGERERLYEAIETHVPALLARGGSHTGVISPEVRAALPPCPACGGLLERASVGGRTTVWCRTHQARPRGR